MLQLSIPLLEDGWLLRNGLHNYNCKSTFCSLIVQMQYTVLVVVVTNTYTVVGYSLFYQCYHGMTSLMKLTNSVPCANCSDHKITRVWQTRVYENCTRERHWGKHSCLLIP